MTARPKALVALVLALAVVVAGCGGGDEEASTAALLTKAAFLKRANAACRKERVGLAERVSAYLGQRTQGGGKPSPDVYADMVHFILLTTIEAEIVRIEELTPPSGDAGRIDALFDAERSAIDKVATTPRIASFWAFDQRFAVPGRMFRAYGLSSCANGPHQDQSKPDL